MISLTVPLLDSRGLVQSSRYFQTLSSAQDSRDSVTFMSRTRTTKPASNRHENRIPYVQWQIMAWNG